MDYLAHGMKSLLTLLLCTCAICSSCGAFQDGKLIQSGLSGNVEALQKLILKNELSRTSEESLARHQLWVFWAARFGLFQASVRIEQRAYNLIRRGRSPKMEFRRELDIINPTQQEEAGGLGALLNYLKAVIDDDKTLAHKLRQEMMAFDIDVLSGKDSDVLSCRSNDVLLPIAQGVVHIFNEDSQPTPRLPKLLYQIPSCVYIPWSRKPNQRFIVDVEVVRQAALISIDRELSSSSDAEGKLLIVIQMGGDNVEMSATDITPGLRSALGRIFDRYNLSIGSDVRICGRKVEAKTAVDIAEISAAELGKESCHNNSRIK